MTIHHWEYSHPNRSKLVILEARKDKYEKKRKRKQVLTNNKSDARQLARKPFPKTLRKNVGTIGDDHLLAGS